MGLRLLLGEKLRLPLGEKLRLLLGEKLRLPLGEKLRLPLEEKLPQKQGEKLQPTQKRLYLKRLGMNPLQLEQGKRLHQLPTTAMHVIAVKEKRAELVLPQCPFLPFSYLQSLPVFCSM